MTDKSAGWGLGGPRLPGVGPATVQLSTTSCRGLVGDRRVEARSSIGVIGSSRVVIRSSRGQ